MISSIQRSKTGVFTDKSSNIVIKITKGDKSRSVGMVNLNLADFIDNDKGKVKMTLEKCPDKDSYIEFSVLSKLINVNAGSDTMSMMSGFDNLDLDSNIDSQQDFGDMESQQDMGDVPKDIDLENAGVTVGNP